MPFVIQTINDEIAFDFGFQLNQLANSNLFSNYKVTLSDIPLKDHIPIGSVEFVHESMELHGFDIPSPINIPSNLNNWDILNRTINYTNDLNEIKVGDFVKSMTKVKGGFTGILYSENDKISLPQDDYLVSEFVDFESEWRAFISYGKIQDVRQYLGDYWVTPNVSIIQHVIGLYKDAPSAYTIDVGVSDDKTSLIEIHNFYSCGLYGFSIRKAAMMWISWWNEFLKNNRQIGKSEKGATCF